MHLHRQSRATTSRVLLTWSTLISITKQLTKYKHHQARATASRVLLTWHNLISTTKKSTKYRLLRACISALRVLLKWACLVSVVKTAERYQRVVCMDVKAGSRTDNRTTALRRRCIVGGTNGGKLVGGRLGGGKSSEFGARASSEVLVVRRTFEQVCFVLW